MQATHAILIAGPTASGKSAVAAAVARAVNGVVINADSMQVYRELPILTAQPGADERGEVPHALYGFLPSREPYSVGRWLDDVAAELRGAEAGGQVPVFAGGTGLYFKALLEGLSPVPEIPGDIRRRWRAAAQAARPGELHSELARRDPEMASRLRPSDPQRIVRALEVIEATGRSLAEWQALPGTPLIPEDRAVRIVISPPREVLHDRINRRFDAMMAGGALEEVEALAAQRLDPELPAMRALGVPPLMAGVQGKISMEAAADRVRAETRQYAKRQATWAKRNMISWKWFTEKDSERLKADILSFIDLC
ncbi:MAG: tRNA (adenosine(37)-N6)-dimethylallyltransferase MiaA [Hyphomicrobiales bacterium]